ncbi:MAG: heme ABC exporter ATP-binding protein CcmA, partial [Myxococcales bacterium]|nr:heme ABC exporter ATP-binding protein CcmA [Myxococcales bacterium]
VSAPAIVARALEKRFGATTVLRGVNLEVPAGANLAVLGPNGAGKSTLLRMMAGLARPSSGSLEVAGRPAHSQAARACVGYIGHATLLYPTLTARENLLFAGRLHGVRDPGARADLLLADAELSDVAHRPAGDFSRGMAQRLAIARGLVHDPAVVLLDEPYTGLDRRSADRLAERLHRLHGEAHTVVLVTHQVEHAHGMDAVLVLARGRVALETRGNAGAVQDLERAYLEATDALR